MVYIGVVTFKNAKKLKQTVEQISLEHILLETFYAMAEPHQEPQRFLNTSLMWLPSLQRSGASLYRECWKQAYFLREKKNTCRVFGVR